MKKKKILLIVLAAILFVGVGVFAFRGFLFSGPKYTVVFDINTTPDDMTDDETWQVLTARLGRGGRFVKRPYRIPGIKNSLTKRLPGFPESLLLFFHWVCYTVYKAEESVPKGFLLF